MATNPRIPEDRDVHPKLQEQFQPKSRVPWVLVAIIVAAAILAALIIWLPRTPRQWTPSGAQVPPQPTGSQLQFTDLHITSAPTGGAIYLEGKMVNTGPTSVNGVQVNATFKGIDGSNLETVRRPVEEMVDNSGTTFEPLANSPIKPTEARPIRIAFDHVPEGWDHKLPALTIINVTAVGNPGNGNLAAPTVNQGENNSGQSAKPPAAQPAGKSPQ